MFKNGGKMVKFTKKQRLLFLVVFVVSQLHEFGHVIGYSIENVSIKFHYGYVEPLNGKIGVLGIMGGPIASILFAIIPLIILCESLQGLDKDSTYNFCKRIQEHSKNNNIVVALHNSDFPQEFCGAIYQLESGFCKKIT